MLGLHLVAPGPAEVQETELPGGSITPDARGGLVCRDRASLFDAKTTSCDTTQRYFGYAVDYLDCLLPVAAPDPSGT